MSEETEPSLRWREMMVLCGAVVLALVAGTHAVAHGLSLRNAAGFAPLISVGFYMVLKYDIVGTPKRRKP